MADTLTITDNRTGKSYDIAIDHGAIKAMDLRQIKASADDFGLMTYDPAFQNTASCRSRITYIDGDKGILLYRGYPIDQLAESSTFLDIAYLLLNGELPTGAEHEVWTQQLAAQPGLPDGAKGFLDGFQRDAHSMGVFLSAGRRPLDLLPGGQARGQRRRPPAANSAHDRAGADRRRLGLSAPRRACRSWRLTAA